MSQTQPLDINIRVARFVCRRCGACCKGDGIVRLTQREVTRIAGLLGLSEQEFLDQYTTLTPWDERVLTDKFVRGERWCVFLERNDEGLHACAIQKAKPAQCVGFPFKWRPPDAVDWCEGLRADP